MPAADALVPLLVFLFPLAFSPGPGNAAFAAIGARAGLAGALPALAGYHAATWGVTLALGLGLFGALAQAPLLLAALKWAGSVYILWLAWRLLAAGPAGTGPGAAGAVAGLGDGAALLLFNPKAYVIIALMFSQFLSPEAGLAGQVLWISTVFTLNNLVAFLVWIAAGAALGRLFRTQAAARALNGAFAALLAGVAIWMALG